MHLSKIRVAATIAGLGLVSSITATPANAAVATFNCGIVTCSVYLTRNTTKQICDQVCQYANESNIAIATASAAACAITGIGTLASVLCAGAGAAYGSFFLTKLEQARDANQCLRIRYTGTNPPILTGLYVDRSGYCKN